MLYYLSEAIDSGCPISVHVISWTLSIFQLVTCCLYLWKAAITARSNERLLVLGLRNMCQISTEAVSLLVVRSILYTVSFASFVYTLRGLNPVSALLALHSGLICMGLMLRLCYIKELIFNITIGKMWITVVFLTFAFYPGLSVV